MNLETVVKATLLLTCAAVVVRVLRNSAASVRAAVCLLALAGAVLVGVCGWIPMPAAIPLDFDAVRFFAGSTGAAPETPGPALPASFLSTLWLAGAAILGLRYFYGLSMVARTVQRSSPLPPESVWRRLAQGTTVRTADVSTPVACGLFRPTILIPTEMIDWPAERSRPVLLHELAHIRRRDLAANVIAALATSLFWFHPLAWSLAARMRREQELACDDAVLAGGVSGHCYAELLVETAADVPGAALFGCAMSGTATQFKNRIAHVLDGNCARLARRGTTLLVSAAFLAVTLALASARPADQAYRIGNGVSAPKVIHKVEPDYTQAARDAKVQGAVVLRVVVGTDGLARDITVEKTIDAGLSQKAIEAIRQWRFEPGRRKGKPVAVKARIEINFRLQ